MNSREIGTNPKRSGNKGRGTDKQQRKEETITLNEKEFFQQRESFDADQEDKKRLLEQSKADGKIFPLTFYNKEVLAVTIDYLKGLGDHKVAKSQ